MIEVKSVRKKFGKLQVLKGFDFRLQTGKITAILGPNGSGKTTLIKSVLGLIIPDEGSIEFDGIPVNGKWKYRKSIAYLPQIARFPENLTVIELLELIQDVRREQAQYDHLVRLFELNGFMKKKLRQLSGGTRQKVNLVLTFMFDCPVYILDEPTSGLDPIALIRLKDLILKKKQQGKTFLITTHIMNLVEELADELMFLLEGEVYFQGTPAEMLLMQKELNLERAIAKILEKEHAENA